MEKIEIKIVTRYTESLLDKERGSYVYDIYHNVSFFRSLFKKWKIDKAALTRKEALAYIGKFALDSTSIAIINC